jgi:hypothetical protein
MMGIIKPELAPNGNFLAVPREGENKILEFDPKGKLIGKYGAFEKLLERPDLTSLLNSDRFDGNQAHGIYVRASVYCDLLEIFNYKTKTFFSVFGPDTKLPEFECH